MMTGQEPADDETEPASEPDPSTQATLDEFSQTGEEQQSSILDDEIFLAGVPDSIEDGARTSDNPFHCQSGAVRAFENLQQSMAEIRRGVLRDVQQAFDGHIEQAVRDLKEVSRSARLARRAVAPALVTSAVASSTVAGVDPAVIQTMGQLPLPEFTEAVRVMVELNTQSLSRMAAQEFQSLSTLAVTQLAEQAAQQMEDATRIVEQAAHLREGMAGMGAMGAATARPGVSQGFDLPEPTGRVENPEGNLSPAQLATHEQGDDIMDWVIVFSPGHGLQIAVSLATAAGAYVTGPHPGAEQVVYLAPVFGLLYVAWQWQQAVTAYRG